MSVALSWVQVGPHSIAYQPSRLPRSGDRRRARPGAACSAQELCRRDRGRVRRLILADTYAGWRGSLGAEAAAQRLERCRLESALPPQESVARWVPVDFFLNASPELSDEMAAVVSEFHPSGFRLMAQTLAEADTRDLLPGIAVPTLLLWGSDDLRAPLQVAEAMRAAIPGARLSVIPEAGHVSNMEQPEAFTAQVRRFLLTDAAGAEFVMPRPESPG